MSSRPLFVSRYFGNNWDALDECLRDIAESRSPRVLLIVTEMPELLSGDKRSREILLETLRSAIEAGLPVLFQSSDERGERVLLEHGINIESAAL